MTKKSYRGKIVNGECPECGTVLYEGEQKQKYCFACETDLSQDKQEVFAK